MKKNVLPKSELLDLMNVGPAVFKDLHILGIKNIDQLKNVSAYELFENLQILTQTKQNPCMIDVFAAIIHEANTGEKQPWWVWTKKRKEKS